MQGFRPISQALADWQGGIGGFTRLLDKHGARYLSFSKVASLEFCQYRYFLEFVQRVTLRPEPKYFVKGRLFHAAMARLYGSLAKRGVGDIPGQNRMIRRRSAGLDRKHLTNALRLGAVNAFQDHANWEIVAIEESFVLSLGTSMPPCVGVVDLILRRGDHFGVVDHKTGKGFGHDVDVTSEKTPPKVGSRYALDNDAIDLQLAIYREFVSRKYKPKTCVTFYDEYRWVNDLARIRKPAFQRVGIELPRNAWRLVMNRLADSYAEMRRIERERDAEPGGSCYECPFKDKCPRTSVGYQAWS